MTPETIRQVISDIAHEQLEWQGQLPDAELTSAFDSMQRLTLVVAVEDHFHICLDAEDEDCIHTVDDLVGVIRKKLDA